MVRACVVCLLTLAVAGGPATAQQGSVGAAEKPASVSSQVLVQPTDAPPRSLLRRLSQPVRRLDGVQALLSDRRASASLQLLLPAVRDPGSLRTTTLSGQSIAATAVPLKRSAEAPPPPASIDGLDWAGGVHISPVSGGPVYRGEARNWACAIMTMRGIAAGESYGFADMVREAVTRHMAEASVSASLHLPGHTGLYLLSFRLDCSDPRVFEAGRAHLRVSMDRPAGFEDIDFTWSPTTHAVVALLELPPGFEPIDPTPEPPMQQISIRLMLSWDSFIRSAYFGGLTVTKL